MMIKRIKHGIYQLTKVDGRTCYAQKLYSGKWVMTSNPYDTRSPFEIVEEFTSLKEIKKRVLTYSHTSGSLVSELEQRS